MNRRTFLAGATSTLWGCPHANIAERSVEREVAPRDRHRAEILTNLRRLGGSGQLGVAFLDTASGQIAGHQLDQRFALCSTFKLPLAAMTLQAFDRGERRGDAMVRYDETDLVNHAPVTAPGGVARGAMSLRALASAAQIASDNVAANLLLREFGGPASLTRFFRSLGDHVSRLDHIELTLNKVTFGDENDTTSPRAMAQLTATFLDPTTLTKESREQLWSWLIATSSGQHRLRAGLPNAWHAGDKTGSFGGAGSTAKCNDVAYVWPSCRPAPVVIAAYYDAMRERDALRAEDEAVLAEVGRLATAWVLGLEALPAAVARTGNVFSLPPASSYALTTTLPMALRKRYLLVCANRRPDDHPKGSCAARGSEAVHGALKKALGTQGLALQEARACTSSCLDVCSQGVTILVEPDHVFLGRVTVADVPAVVAGLATGTFPPALLLTREEIDAG